ncbi:hypothetical protein ACVISU_005492 [Bradyrhizobium sp. USDA 4452]
MTRFADRFAPLAIEQRNEITVDRVAEIYARYGHGAN